MIMKLVSRTISVVVLFLGITFSAGAQTPEPAPTPAPSPPDLAVPKIAPDYKADQKPLPELGRVGVDMITQTPLPLREAISMALANNKDIEVARDNVKIAEFDLKGAHGAFDPRLSFSSYYGRVKTPVSSFLTVGSNGLINEDNFANSARLEGLSKLGGRYTLDFSSNRYITNNQFTGLSPNFPASLTFNYVQPLWRGLSTDNSRRQIEIARKNLSLTDAQFRQRAMETITNVQRSYWDLVFALRNLQIQRDAVADARSQLEHNRRLVSEGQLAPIDIVAAEAQVAGVEQDLFTALEEVSRAENVLKNLISEDRKSPIWNSSITPTDPVNLDAPAVSLPEALKTAMENRPELLQSTIAREINEVDRRYFANQTKPEINLTGSYGIVGLAGSINTNSTNPFASTALIRDRVNVLSDLAGLPLLPTPPPQTFNPDLLGGYGQSLQNLFSNQFNNFRVGVTVSLPLRNRTAEAALGRSLVEGERIDTMRQQLEQSIQVEVRDALQSVRTAEARLRAAAAARNANEQQYQSEQRRLDAGQSTVFLVLERQTALTTARGNELRAQTDLNKAIAELQRATGNALSVNSVVVRAR
jgi:HAE1 family hydrophobic/amphiphilic exporter-1